MNIRKTIITATVALTMVAMIAPTTAGAATIADLQAQINALMAQLQAMQGSTTTVSGSVPAACVGVTFGPEYLRVGMTSAKVKCLQVILNMSASTQVSASGAGSPGNETMYFGQLTLAAVMKWQTQQGWVPASQVGPKSNAALNAWLASRSTTNPPPTPVPPAGLPAGCTSSAGYSPVTGQSCATGVTTQTGPVTAMLSSDNPAAGAIVGGQATADLLHVTFSGNGTVTSVTLNRSGISDQNTLANVYLYDGNVRITDGYSFNVSGQIVINGLSIAVAGSHTISVRADVASGAATTSSTVAVSLTGFTANGSSSTVNIMGNTMAVVVGNLATAYLGANTTSATATVNAGTSGYTFWSAPLQINTRAVWLKGANFKMIGSAPSDALGNIRMFIDGVDTGKVGVVMAINGSNYAVFDLTSAPISLMTGSHTVDMRADIQKGTNRTVQVSIQQASDITIFDPQVGVNIATLGPAGAAFSANTGTNVTIATGSATVVVDPTFTSQTNIAGGSTNAVIARFKIHAYGEDIKVTSLQVTPEIDSAVTQTVGACTTNSSGVWTAGTCGANNVTLYFNGSQVGSQQNWTMTSASNSNAPLTFQLGSQMIAPAGQDSYLEVRMDLQTAATVNYTGGTVKATLVGLTSNAQGMSSQATLGVPQTTSVSTTGLTMQTDGLQVSKNTAYLSQNINPNTVGVKIGSYVLQNQSTSEAMRVTSFTIVTTTTTATISNFSALRTSDTTGSGSTPIQFSGTGTGTTSTDTFSVNDTLAVGASMVVDIFANTGSATSGTIATSLNVTSIGAVDNISTASGAKTGQTLTLGVGTLAAPTLVVASSTVAQYIPVGSAGSTNASTATFSFVSTSGSANITELAFTVSGSDGNPSQAVTQACVTPTTAAGGGATVCASPVTVSGTQLVDMTGLNLLVPNAGAGLNQAVLLSYSGISPVVATGSLNPGTTSTVKLAYIKYNAGGTVKTLGSSTVCTALGVTCTDNTLTAVAHNDMTLVGSRPTLTVAAGGATGMIMNTSTKVGQVTITADAKGDVKLRQLHFSIGYSGFTSNAGAGPSTISSAFLALGGQSTGIAGVTCTAVDINNVVCKTTTDGGTFAYGSDFTVAAGTSQQFDLYITTTGEANTGTNKASVSSSVYNVASGSTSSTASTTSAFLWDDTANNGGTGSTGLTGDLIYGFPTGAYSVSQ